MQVNKDEAAQALQEIDGAYNRTIALRRYRHSAPYFMVWGIAWLVAGSVTDVIPRAVTEVWWSTTLLGAIASIAINFRMTAKAAKDVAQRLRWRWGATFLIVIGYFLVTHAILGTLSWRQQNAFIALFWPFLYMLVGIWAGWKIFGVGLATATLILIGYFAITSHYSLWTGVVGGGALILGGVWVRRI